jgi:splicing factor 3B subunit 3
MAYSIIPCRFCDTMAGADKFGNVYFVRLPQDVSDEIEEDPTGGKLSGSRESLMELQTR